jgi:hypothetical protein
MILWVVALAAWLVRVQSRALSHERTHAEKRDEADRDENFKYRACTTSLSFDLTPCSVSANIQYRRATKFSERSNADRKRKTEGQEETKVENFFYGVVIIIKIKRRKEIFGVWK